MQKELVKGFRLSPQQQHLWALQQQTGKPAYHAQCAVLMEGNLDRDRLKTALQQVVERHEILRTGFHCSHETALPVQVIGDAGAISVDEMELAGLSHWEQETEIERLMHEASGLPSIMEEDSPLRRVSLVALSPETYVLLVKLPALCADMATLELLVREIARNYEWLNDGAPPAEAPAQYADISEWQNILLESEDAEVGRAYWRQLNITALPELKLPSESPRERESEFAPVALSQVVEPEVAAALEEVARRLQTTPSTVLLACWQILLWRLTAQPNIVVGCSYDGRNFPELEETLGLLAKHLPILSRLEDGQRFEEVVRQVAAVAGEASRWQESFSWEQMAESNTGQRVEPFPAFSFEFAETPARHAGANVSFSIYRSLGVVDKFKVKLCCARRDRSLLLNWQYDASLFQLDEIERLSAQYRTLLRSAVRDPAQFINRLEILSGAERQRLLFEVNGERRKFAVDQCLHEMFEAQAARTPEAVALVFEDEQVSYQELNRRANQLAHHLRQMGVGPEARVGLLLERSVEMVVGALAVLKAGGAYVPLDTQYPQERLSFILDDAACAVLLTHGRAGVAPPVRAGQTLDLDQQRAEIARQSESNPSNITTTDNLAYVIYTSGSTGTPKGTLVAHANVLRLFAATQDWFHFDEQDVWTLFHSIAFDFSVWELWGALLYGGRLVVVPLMVSRAAEQFDDLLRREQVTVLNQTPSAFYQLMEVERSKHSGEDRELALRLVIFGGEALDIGRLRGWFARRGDRRPQLVNMYGITETTVHVTYRPLRAPDCESEAGSRIGVGIADLQVYVLDREMEPVPLGVAGEMYVGGAGVARGYLNRAELTAERFVPHLYSEEEGARLYRTGDLCVRRADGELEYLGRIDQQVKIRGFRIELGEIEARLAQHGGVREAVVLAREDEAGDKRLVAYVVAAGEGQQPRAEAVELREYLKRTLPDYMIPSAFVTLDEMPLTTNGKVDRKALPAPEQNQAARARTLTAARTPVEEVLAGIWAEVLGVAGIGVDDNFFDLGGHSLLVTRLVSRVREAFKVELSLGSIFETPTLAQMGRSIEAAMQCAQGMEVAPVRRASRDGQLPLSFAQQRLWFIDQLEPHNPFYNIPTAFRLTGQLNVAALEQTLNEIVRRHEVLRTSFVTVDGQPAQVIAEPQPLSLPVEDLTLLAEDEREAEARRVACEEAQRAFDLSVAPLVRARLLRLAEAEHVVLFTMHHIVSDGWSIGVLIGEVAALYKAFSGGQPSPLPELSIQYADFAAWQRGWLAGEVLDRQLTYWKRQLGGALPVMELPTDYARPPVYSHRGGQFQFRLSKEVSGALRELSRAEGATLFMTLLAAFQTLLSRYSGQEEAVVGTDIANRNRGETEQLIGFFVNQLVMRTDLSGNPSFRELLRRVREVALGAYVHQDVPFEKLVEELRPERDLSRNPLFQVKFILQNTPASALELPGLTLSQMSSESYTTRFDLTFSMMDAESGLFGAVEYSAELFAETTIRRMVEHFKTLLEGVVADPQQRIMALPLMNAAERREALIDWNDTKIEYPRERCIHELFEEQAARRPEAVAVVFEDERLSYGELNARANQLAHYLRTMGVGAEVLVGLFVERSIEMLVGVLGILKAGGAYVPLDPSYPLDRLSFMIEDAGVPVLLTEERLLDNLPADWRQVVCLDTGWEKIAAGSRQNPSSVTTPDNLAYVIYTSGSTGTPKGVELAHRGLVNMSQAQARAFSLNEENRVLQFASLSFDASIFEIVMGCATGATLYLAHRDRLLPGIPLAGLLRERSISNVTLPPSALAQLPETELPALRTIIVAGEACGAELVERWARGRRFFNAYGPSEATVWSSVAECVAGTGRRPHIGRPIDNTQIYLLDQNLEPVPVGVAGELRIGGEGLARCYLGRPELTAERFLPNPFSAEPGRRIYSTGDVARYLNDGSIEFAGRVDHQVKVRGFRIELGEVEAALDRHPSVRECVVVAREDEPGDKRLVAYIVTMGESAPTVSELRAHLKDALPEYMIPSAFVMLDALPVSPSGKVERRALPAPDAARPVLENAYQPAQTPLEEVLVAIYAEVLEVEQVGAHDSFFELGGHSLLATQLISRIREAFDVELSLRSIFETPSVAELARTVEATQQAERGLQAPPMVAVAREGQLPLSFAQQRLWFIDQLEPGSPLYNLPAAVRLRGELNFEALEQTVNEIVRRHEVLRTTFATQNGQPAQVIAPFAPFALPLSDLGGLPEAEREAEALRLATVETKTPFDLSAGPLMRVQVLRLDEQEHVMLFTMHHSISDGWSMGVLVREVAALYTAYCEGEASPLPELPVQYADFAAWQRQWLRGETLDAQLAYWKQQLRGAPALLELPTTRPRTTTQNFRGDRQSFVYPVSLSEQLKALSQREKSTLFMTLVAAFATQLHRYSGQEDIVLGTDVANRNRAETEGLIGFFVNQLVLRADLSGNPTFSELLVRVREMTLGAYAHQDMPFDKLVESLRPDRAISRTPLFQAKLVLLNAPLQHLELPGLTLSSVDVRDESGTAKFDLVVTLMDTAEGLIGYMEYNTDLFDEPDVTRLIEHYGTLLGSVVAQPESRLSALEMLSETELHEREMKKRARAETNLRKLKSIKPKAVSLPQVK